LGVNVFAALNARQGLNMGVLSLGYSGARSTLRGVKVAPFVSPGLHAVVAIIGLTLTEHVEN